MQVKSINNRYDGKHVINFQSKNANFSKYFNNKKLEESLNKINQKQDTQNLFRGITAIAGALAAEFVLFAEENKEVKEYAKKALDFFGINSDGTVSGVKEQDREQKVDISKLIDEKPERKTYLKITSYFPNLDSKYKQKLEEIVSNPENETDKLYVETLESLFNYMADSERLISMRKYIASLDEHAENLDGVMTNMLSTIKNGNSFMYYLVLLHNGKLTPDNIKLWARNDALSCDEFMLLKNFDEKIVSNINALKQKNNNFKITSFEKMEKSRYDKNYAFKLSFPENMPIQDKLKTAADVHKAIYGEIYVKGKNGLDMKFLGKDIQTEMIDGVLKDNQIDSVYNFVKYISPEALKNIKLNSDEVKYLEKGDELYKQIANVCMKKLVNIDFNSPKVKEFVELIGNDDIFGSVLPSRHARIRFVTRFVLKNNPKAKLTEECKDKIKILQKEIDNELDKCNYFCYCNGNGTAPQFYLKGSKLGNYIKVTLNDTGAIHTIYEDFRKIQQNAK